MSNLLPEQDLSNPKIDTPWKRSETDKMLDLYFEGTRPDRIAHILGRNPKAVKRRIEQFAYNEFDRTLQYRPVCRTSRRGKRFTPNEESIKKTTQERNVPVKDLARLLAREVTELQDPKQEGCGLREIQRVIQAPTLDLLLACRYMYYVSKQALVSDAVYDDLLAEELELGTGADQITGPPKCKVTDYEPHIRSLALYLYAKMLDRGELTVRYGIGEMCSEGSIGFWYGPVESLQEVRTTEGKSDRSVLVKFDGHGKTTVLAKWNDGRWVRNRDAL